MRERGLKCNHAVPRLKNLSRSREGAWIEIALQYPARTSPPVAPVRERGLKSDEYFDKAKAAGVAPVRERGLKSAGEQQSAIIPGRSREGAWIEIYRAANDYKGEKSLP